MEKAVRALNITAALLLVIAPGCINSITGCGEEWQFGLASLPDGAIDGDCVSACERELARFESYMGNNVASCSSAIADGGAVSFQCTTSRVCY